MREAPQVRGRRILIGPRVWHRFMDHKDGLEVGNFEDYGQFSLRGRWRHWCTNICSDRCRDLRLEQV